MDVCCVNDCASLIELFYRTEEENTLSMNVFGPSKISLKDMHIAAVEFGIDLKEISYKVLFQISLKFALSKLPF